MHFLFGVAYERSLCFEVRPCLDGLLHPRFARRENAVAPLALRMEPVEDTTYP